MPPKKKTSVSGPAQTSNSNAKDDSSDSDNGACWYWAGDSDPSNPDKSQDVWVRYSDDITGLIEKAFAAMKPKVKIDSERYVDLHSWLQRRNDDPDRRRAVLRSQGPLADLKRVKAKPARDDSDDDKKTKKAKTKKAAAKKKKDDDDDVIDDSPPKKAAKKKKVAAKKAAKDDDDDDVIDDEPKKKKTKTKAKAKAPAKKKQKAADDDDDRPVWQWAGDSVPGKTQQDMWVDYDEDISNKLESQLKKGSRKVKISSTHYVDLAKAGDWWQCRYDDPDKRRSVRRRLPGDKDDDEEEKEEEEEEEEEEEAVVVTAKKQKTGKSSAVAVKKDKEEEDEDDKKSKDKDEDKKAKVSKLVHSLSSSMSVVAASLKASLEYPDNWEVVESMLPVEVDVGNASPEFKAVQKLMTDTIAKIHVGNTQNHLLAFHGFTVTRLVRVQNPILWVNYHNRMNRVEKKLNEQGGATPVSKVITQATEVGIPLNAGVNEAYLWHGLNHDHVETITKEGFNPRFCSLNGMFGSALYFGEHSSKANQYTHSGVCTVVGGTPGLANDPCVCKRSDEACLLLCRVILGDALVEKDYRGNAPGQFWYQLRTEPKKPNGHIYNSVIGEAKTNYANAALRLREYIIYEQTQAYPEYKVFYKRNP